MPTPLSNSTSYCTPGEFLKRYDANQVGDLVSDGKVRVPATALLTDPNVQAALDTASGDVEAACLVAGKYTPTDLAALTGVSQKLLYGIISDLAYWRLVVRRYPGATITDAAKGGMVMLERLRFGERIFGLQEQADAGLPASTFPTITQLYTPGFASMVARRYFGIRGKERRLDL